MLYDNSVEKYEVQEISLTVCIFEFIMFTIMFCIASIQAILLLGATVIDRYNTQIANKQTYV